MAERVFDGGLAREPLSCVRMKWIFRVAYRTVFGESLWLCLKDAQGEVTEHAMRWRDREHWEVMLESVDLAGASYRYRLRREGCDSELDETGEERRIVTTSTGGECVLFLDDWQSPGTEDRVYETAVFFQGSG